MVRSIVRARNGPNLKHTSGLFLRQMAARVHEPQLKPSLPQALVRRQGRHPVLDRVRTHDRNAHSCACSRSAPSTVRRPVFVRGQPTRWRWFKGGWRLDGQQHCNGWKGAIIREVLWRDQIYGSVRACYQIKLPISRQPRLRDLTVGWDGTLNAWRSGVDWRLGERGELKRFAFVSLCYGVERHHNEQSTNSHYIYDTSSTYLAGVSHGHDTSTEE